MITDGKIRYYVIKMTRSYTSDYEEELKWIDYKQKELTAKKEKLISYNVPILDFKIFFINKKWLFLLKRKKFIKNRIQKRKKIQ